MWRDPRACYDKLSDHTTEPRLGFLLASQGLPVRVIVPSTIMYIHVIGLAYILYAFNLMYVLGNLVHPRLKVTNPVTLAAVFLSIAFVKFLLLHNPLAGFRDYTLLVVHLLACLAVAFIGYDEQDENKVGKLKTTFLIGLCGLALGVAIAWVQLKHSPAMLIG